GPRHQPRGLCEARARDVLDRGLILLEGFTPAVIVQVIMRDREGAVAVFVRWPEPGQVLPQLVRRIGAEAAAQLYDAFIGDLIAGMPLSSFDGYLYALDNLHGFIDRYKGVHVRSQQGSNEGRRLRGCFEA